MPLTSLEQAWLQARESADAALCYITIYHPMMETLRFVRNTVGITSRGDFYSPAPFELDILNDNDQPPRATITFPNVHRTMGITLSQIVGPPQITIEVIPSSNPDAPLQPARAARLRLQNVNVEPLVLSGDLLRIDDGTEVCGTIRIVPARAPALFRAR